MDKIRWGILSTAKIGRERVIPAIQAASLCSVNAIASRDAKLANATAASLGILKAYTSYEALLLDEDIDAVYIPLPNHLHVPWAIKALEANKHVLCEKPVALTAKEAEELQIVANAKPHLKVMEAFMYRFHPQWEKVKAIIKQAAIGELKTINSSFTYYNTDANNIRNQKAIGGGGLMDIGCYCISLARFIFEDEPESVVADIEFDPVMETDRVASAILHFNKGTSTFTCSTQLVPYQHATIYGTTGRIEIEIPFNGPSAQRVKIWLHNATGTEEIIFDAIDQYTLQANAFAKAILDDTPVPTGLQDTVNNMRVIEAVFKAAEIKQSVSVMQNIS
jgi:predicted dehydrogenase